MFDTKEELTTAITIGKGRPFFVCTERENQCKFWQWGDVYESPRPLCQHCMVCCERKVKKDSPN